MSSRGLPRNIRRSSEERRRSSALLRRRRSSVLRSSRGIVVPLPLGMVVLPPVLRQQVIQYVVHGHRAEQPALVVEYRRRYQVVRRQVLADRLQTVVRPQPVQIGVDRGRHQLRRWFAQQSLDVADPDEPSGRSLQRRTTDVDHRGQRWTEFGVADMRERIGHSGVDGQDDRLRRHQTAGGVLLIGEQAPYVLSLVRLHQRQQPLGGVGRQLGDQVGRVVRRHLLQHVRSAFGVQTGQDLDLVVFRQFLEYVGQSLVVQRRSDLLTALGGQIMQYAGQV